MIKSHVFRLDQNKTLYKIFIEESDIFFLQNAINISTKHLCIYILQWCRICIEFGAISENLVRIL